MINSNRLAYGERKLSDAVLDGLFGGLAGGIAMAIYLVLWGLLAGALYGLALLAVAKLVALPAGGSALAEIPTLHFAVAHLLYGAVLGLLAEHMAGRAA